MSKTTFEELKQKYPILDVAPYGFCLVVPGTEFDPDWEASLAELRYKCFFTDLDGKAVTLVQQKLPPNKVPYIPPAAAEKALPEKKNTMLRGLNWTKNEDVQLLKAYDALVLEGKKYGASKFLHEIFPQRQDSSVEQQLKRLLKKRVKQTPKKNPEEHKEPVYKATNIELAQTIEILAQKYDKIEQQITQIFDDVKALKAGFEASVKAAAEMREDFEADVKMKSEITEEHRQEINDLTTKFKHLQSKLSRHEHSRSGQTLVPLEAT